MKWDEMYKYTLELGLGFDKISENRRNIYDRNINNKEYSKLISIELCQMNQVD